MRLQIQVYGLVPCDNDARSYKSLGLEFLMFGSWFSSKVYLIQFPDFCNVGNKILLVWMWKFSMYTLPYGFQHILSLYKNSKFGEWEKNCSAVWSYPISSVGPYRWLCLWLVEGGFVDAGGSRLNLEIIPGEKLISKLDLCPASWLTSTDSLSILGAH